MKDGELDEVLNPARIAQHPTAEMLARISAEIGGSLRPVRPLPPVWALAAGLVLIWAVVAGAGAARAGLFGFAKMDTLERVLVFAAIGVCAVAAAVECVRTMIPGSRRRMSSGALVGLGCVLLLGVFAVLFRDYQVTHFVHAGLVCLGIGLMHAVAAGVLSWVVLRRGFAVDAVSAGLAAGMLAGLAGVGMLELHCPNFEAAHVLVWHTAVVPVSAGLGAGVARLFRRS